MACLVVQAGSVVSFDLSTTMSMDCLNNPNVNYFNELSTYLVAPLAVGLYVFIVYRNKIRKLRSKIR